MKIKTNMTEETFNAITRGSLLLWNNYSHGFPLYYHSARVSNPSSQQRWRFRDDIKAHQAAEAIMVVVHTILMPHTKLVSRAQLHKQKHSLGGK